SRAHREPATTRGSLRRSPAGRSGRRARRPSRRQRRRRRRARPRARPAERGPRGTVARMTDRTDWQARRQAWKVERLDPALARAPERQAGFRTLGEIELDPVYGPWSLPEPDAGPDRIGLPGEAPFTRGIHPTGYRSRLWTMRMFAGFGAAEDTNRRFKDLLAAGQTGLSIAYDMPT